MSNEIFDHITKAIEYLSQGDFRDRLIAAKEEYFKITGIAHDDDDDFEMKMDCFNDWYLLQYHGDSGRPTIDFYFDKNNVDEDIKKWFDSFNYSLFEFVKVNWKNKVVLKDLLHNNKIILAKDHPDLGIVESDIFNGRIINTGENNYLLRGLCLFPSEAKSILQKQAKKVRKLKDLKQEEAFLLSTEQLKTKWKRYGHINLEKIFVFDQIM